MWRRAKTVRATLTSLLLLVAAGTSDAKVGEFTGDDYLHQCTSADPHWTPQNNSEQEMAVFCVGYIEGAITLIISMDRREYCLPTGATPQDVIKTTFAFLQAHPDQKQHLFASVMLAAVLDRWPCR
jgi:Rap1a immunity proteins